MVLEKMIFKVFLIISIWKLPCEQQHLFYSKVLSLMSFLHIRIDTISMEYSILYSKGLPIEISIKGCIVFHEDAFM